MLNFQDLIELIELIDLIEFNYLLVENELKKLKVFDSIYFTGKSHFKRF